MVIEQGILKLFPARRETNRVRHHQGATQTSVSNADSQAGAVYIDDANAHACHRR